MAELDALPALKGKGKRPLIQEGERGVPRPPLKSRRASAGSTIPRRGDAHMAGIVYFRTDALVVGPWTSMVAYPARRLPSRWAQDEGAGPLRRASETNSQNVTEHHRGGDQNPVIGTIDIGNSKDFIVK